MQPQLGEADLRAVDVLLDRLPHSQNAAQAGFTASAQNSVGAERLDAARHLLARLDAFEVDEPAADLVARTLSRIAEFSPAGLAATESDASSLPQALLTRPGLDG